MGNELKWKCAACNQYLDADTLDAMVKSRVAVPVLIQTAPVETAPAPKPVRKKKRPAPVAVKAAPLPLATEETAAEVYEDVLEE